MSGELKQRLRVCLEQRAREEKTISYRELAQLAEVPGPQVIRRLTETLEDIIREDCAAGIAVSVACLAVSQTTPIIPRAGYFMLLRELKLYDGPDAGEQAQSFHSACLRRVFQDYARK